MVISVMRKPPPGKQQPKQQAAGGNDASLAPGTPSTTSMGAAPAQDPASYYIVDVLLACAPGSVEAGAPRPAEGQGEGEGGAAEPVVLPVALPLVHALSTLRVALPADLRPLEARCVRGAGVWGGVGVGVGGRRAGG